MLLESGALLIKAIRKYGCQANSSSALKIVNRFTLRSVPVHQKRPIELMPGSEANRVSVTHASRAVFPIARRGKFILLLKYGKLVS